MSSWWETESTAKKGRIDLNTGPGAEVIVALTIVLAPIMISGVSGFRALAASGFGFFLAAKLSVLSDGRFLSWGSARMVGPFRTSYRVGYALMGLSLVALLGATTIGR